MWYSLVFRNEKYVKCVTAQWANVRPANGGLAAAHQICGDGEPTSSLLELEQDLVRKQAVWFRGSSVKWFELPKVKDLTLEQTKVLKIEAQKSDSSGIVAVQVLERIGSC